MRDAEGKEPVIRRSDFLKFVLAVKDGESEYSIADVQNVHIFAKAMQRGVAPTKDAPALFYKIFDKAENGEYEIPSELTTGAAGYYMLSVVLVKDTNLMTAFAGVFELRENGSDIIDRENATPEYSGMFAQMLQAAMEAANAAAESKADAETALENIQSLETTIEGYKTAAQDAAEAAADSEAFAAQNAQEAEDFRDEAEGFAAAAQSSKTAAELAAQTAVNSSDLAALCRRAANVGFFEFNTGKLAFDKPGIIAAPPFSLCITYDVDSWAGLGNSPTGGLAFFNNHCVIWTDPYQKGGFHLCYEEAGRLFFACGNLDAAPATREFKATINKPLPPGRHTLVVCVLESLASSGAAAVRCYVDGLYFGDMSLSYNKLSGDDISSTFPFQINTIANYASSTVASCPIDTRLSRVKIFNFDMTAEGAPYTVADYAAGIDPSPAIMHGGEFYNISGFGSYNSTTVTSCTVSGDVMTIVKNAGSPSYVTFPLSGAVESGETVELSFEADARPYVVGLLPSENYLSAEIEQFGNVSLANGTYSLTPTKRMTHLGVMLTSATTQLNISQLTIRRSGTLLKLSDSADASQIRDESGNGNHALISGAVLPSKNNNPARCAQTITWAGTSTLQNVCGDSAIPANSKVTAYAKATGALTASFKAGANAAESKELAANTLTEISSWLCGAAGAFSVQPSAAYTGSIETYLKIERF